MYREKVAGMWLITGRQEEFLFCYRRKREKKNYKITSNFVRGSCLSNKRKIKERDSPILGNERKRVSFICSFLLGVEKICVVTIFWLGRGRQKSRARSSKVWQFDGSGPPTAETCPTKYVGSSKRLYHTVCMYVCMYYGSIRKLIHVYHI